MFRADPLRREHPVEKGGDQALPPLDELGVDLRDVELAKVESVEGTGPKMAEDPQEAVGLLPTAMDLQRPLQNPALELREGRHNRLRRPKKDGPFLLASDEPKARGGIVKENRHRQTVLSQDPVVDGPPLDPEGRLPLPGRPRKGADPEPHLLEAVEKLPGGDPGKGDLDRSRILPVEGPKEVPPLPQAQAPLLEGLPSRKARGAPALAAFRTGSRHRRLLMPLPRSRSRLSEGLPPAAPAPPVRRGIPRWRDS